MSVADYQLDTDTVVGLLRGRPTSIRERIRGAIAAEASLAISSVVLFELTYGIARSGRPAENADRLREFLAGGILVLPVTEHDARAAASVRAELAAAGTPIGPYDVLIAGQARSRDAVLVTGNTREFGRVRGLRLEDWGVPSQDRGKGAP